MKNNNYMEIYFDYWVPSIIVIAFSPYLCDLVIAMHPNLDILFYNKIFNIFSILAPGWHSEIKKTILLLEDTSAKRYIYGIYISNIFLFVFTLHFLFISKEKFNKNFDIKKETMLFLLMFWIYFGFSIYGLYTFPPKISRSLNFSDGNFALMTHASIFSVTFLPIVTQILSIFQRLLNRHLDRLRDGSYEQ